MMDEDEEKNGGDNDEVDEKKIINSEENDEDETTDIDDQIITEAMSRPFYALLSFTILFVFIALGFCKIIFL